MIPLSVLRSLACATLVFFVAGMAACLVCDLDSCCEDSEHDDSADCACSCIIHGTMGMTAPQVAMHPDDGGCEILVAAPRIPSVLPQSLFRPPRA